MSTVTTPIPTWKKLGTGGLGTKLPSALGSKTPIPTWKQLGTGGLGTGKIAFPVVGSGSSSPTQAPPPGAPKQGLASRLIQAVRNRLILEISPAWRMRTTLSAKQVADTLAAHRKGGRGRPNIKTPKGVLDAFLDADLARNLIQRLNDAKARSEQERLASGGMTRADYVEQGMGGSLPSVEPSATQRWAVPVVTRKVPYLKRERGYPGPGVSTLDDSDLASYAAERAFHIASQGMVARMRRMIDAPLDDDERRAGLIGLARHAAAIERGRRTGVWRSEWLGPARSGRRPKGGGGFGGNDRRGGPPAKPKGRGPNSPPTNHHFPFGEHGDYI